MAPGRLWLSYSEELLATQSGITGQESKECAQDTGLQGCRWRLIAFGRGVTMSISAADIDEVLVILDEGRQSWIDGKLGYVRGFDIEQDEDMTIFGPFGGEALRGTAQLAGRQDRVASLFRGGSGRWTSSRPSSPTTS